MSREPRIYIAGHRGMVGSAIVRTLLANGQTNLVTRTHAELELTELPPKFRLPGEQVG
jgi:GDP-L-fucose synthase